VNPGFDVDLEGWSCTNGGICDWIEDDPEASTLSGSGQITSGGGFDGLLESSCVSVEEGEVYEFSAWAKTTGVIGARLYALWSSSDGCAGGVVGNETVGLSPPDNTWRHF
jgi:hypothetical protein